MKKSLFFLLLILIIGGIYFLSENSSQTKQIVAPYISTPLQEGKSYLDPA